MGKIYCPECGYQLPDTAKFCNMCGNKIIRIPTPNPAPAQAPTNFPTPNPAPAQAPTNFPAPNPAPAQAPTQILTPNPAPAQTTANFPKPNPAPAQAQSNFPTPNPAPAQAPTNFPTPNYPVINSAPAQTGAKPFPVQNPAPQTFGSSGMPSYYPQNKAKKGSNKKTLIIVSSVLGGIAVLIFASLAFIFLALPSINYSGASKALNAGNYDEAYEKFTALGDYRDSSKMATEALYRKADAMLAQGNFIEAMTAFEILGDYKDSAEKFIAADYGYGNELLEQKEYKEAADVFEALGDYEDSAEKYKLARYNNAVQLLRDDEFFEALDIFKSLGNYKDSKAMIKETKYCYIITSMDNDDAATYEFLKELKNVNYKDCKKIFKELYAWKATDFYFNTDPDSTESVDSISKSSPLYCHFTISGGTPDGTFYPYAKAVWPDGSSMNKQKSAVPMYRDGTFWWGWSDGIYVNPQKGKTGTFTLTLYDEEGNVIGAASVKITK